MKIKEIFTKYKRSWIMFIIGFGLNMYFKWLPHCDNGSLCGFSPMAYISYSLIFGAGLFILGLIIEYLWRKFK